MSSAGSWNEHDNLSSAGSSNEHDNLSSAGSSNEHDNLSSAGSSNEHDNFLLERPTDEEARMQLWEEALALVKEYIADEEVMPLLTMSAIGNVVPISREAHRLAKEIDEQLEKRGELSDNILSETLAAVKRFKTHTSKYKSVPDWVDKHPRAWRSRSYQMFIGFLKRDIRKCYLLCVMAEVLHGKQLRKTKSDLKKCGVDLTWSDNEATTPSFRKRLRDMAHSILG